MGPILTDRELSDLGLDDAEVLCSATIPYILLDPDGTQSRSAERVFILATDAGQLIEAVDDDGWSVEAVDYAEISARPDTWFDDMGVERVRFLLELLRRTERAS